MEDKIEGIIEKKDVNNMIKILPSEICIHDNDKEKIYEEKISIENLINNELELNITVSNQKYLNVSRPNLKLINNETSDLTVKFIPPKHDSEEVFFISFKFLDMEHKVYIREGSAIENKTRNTLDDLPNKLDLKKKLSETSLKAKLSNQTINKNDKVFSEYSCKLLNSSLSNSLKLDHKNTENKEIEKRENLVPELEIRKDYNESCESINNSKISKDEGIIQKLNKQIQLLNQENKSFKERYDRMITKMKTMEEIIKEYQTIISQNSLFKNLKIEEAILFSIPTRIRNDKKTFFPSGKGGNLEDLYGLSSKINENIEISQVLIKQKYQNLSETFGQRKNGEESLKQINNDIQNEIKNLKKSNEFISLGDNIYNLDNHEKQKGNLYLNPSDYSNINNKTNRASPLQDNSKQVFKRKLNTEELKNTFPRSKIEVQNAIEFAINSETLSVIDLKKIDDETIIRLRERFLELQYFSFNENKKRIESLLQIQDNFLHMIFDIKEKYSKHIQALQEENNTNQLKILMEDDFMSKSPFREFSEKNFFLSSLNKLEEQLKLFMNKASSINTEELLQEHLYIQTTNQINTQENLQEKTKVLEELWNELQNMDLISNELYNFKVENKRLSFENKSLIGEISNSNNIIDELKQTNANYEQEFSDLEKELNTKDDIINEKDNIIIQLEKEIEDLKINVVDPVSQDEMISKYEEKIKLLSSQLNQNQLYMQQLNDYCEDYKNSIGNLYRKLSLKDNEILELKSQLVIKDKIMLNIKKSMNNSSLSVEKNINLKENDIALSVVNNKDSKELREKDSTIEELKLMNNKLYNELKRIQINEKSITTNYKLLSLENENLLKSINDMKNYSQLSYIDRRKLLKIDHVLLNKLFVFFTDILIEIFFSIGKKIPCNNTIDNESTLFVSIENKSKILKDYINNIISIFKSNSFELLENSLKVNTEKILEFFNTILLAI